jgi:glycosyltransferase involved in cell wall biosynthesis
MSRMQAAELEWQLIIVDNADDAATRATCKNFESELPLVYLVCKQRGKNAALNYGLEHATGDVFVFTDDDVLPASDWLMAMRAGAVRWPDHVLFGGCVLPKWPAQPPEFVAQFAANPDYGRWTYGVLDLDAGEGPNAKLLPLGANMAVRRKVFDEGARFSESIGPNGGNYAMGSETELNLRLRRHGHEAVYLPDSLVYHQIRPEQMTLEWIKGRAFREGRGEVRLNPNRSVTHALRLAAQAARAHMRYFKAIMRGQQANAAVMQMRRTLATGRLYETIRMTMRLA